MPVPWRPSIALEAATLLRLRRKRTESKPFKAAVNLQVGHRESR